MVRQAHRTPEVALGTWRTIWAASPEGPLYSERPIFGIRACEKFPHLVQVLTDYMDFGATKRSRQWINVHKEDVNLK